MQPRTLLFIVILLPLLLKRQKKSDGAVPRLTFCQDCQNFFFSFFTFSAASSSPSSAAWE